MEINILIDEGLEGYVEEHWLEIVVKKILVAQGADSGAELGLVIASQERVQQLNSTYLGKDAPTDVLAFAMLPEPAVKDPVPFVAPPDDIQHLGEVIISYPQAVIQAEEHKHSVIREISILIVHGVLHLLGYDHDNPERERQMKARETEILSNISKETANRGWLTHLQRILNS
ncbi:MAG: rRNA maturation RNase YbeY [Dehalococcoidales bacterium]|nr:rRNA maturation RNase YbeY [Dehalococcoidales bacterium]